MKTVTALAALVGIAAAVPAHAQADGKALFQKNCAACHQANGKGIPGAFPALAGNAFLQGPAKDPAGVLLKGRGGMPDFSQVLSDGDIAAVLTYARSSWGNRAEVLTEQEVSALRNELSVERYAAGQMSNKH